MSLEKHILNILNDSPEGLSDEVLSKKLKKVKDEDRLTAINALLSTCRIEVTENADKDIVYKYISEEEAQKLRELSPEEAMIYKFIDESGNKGLWITDIKKKAGPLSSNASQIVKKLEKKGFIKGVKTIKAKNRKVWMLMSVEPSPEVTGGVLADDVFDLELMDLIGQK
mmetsp:Transcript_18525/g.18228  ORF Transcript_18525/g.18228 Transcript_18525/m.18228 type:complete len:169 (-) Transcript_18525:256-762(-)|eukprot:CAMPEP_0197014362 /NCGR_PEP_ID=MMETSP1380-20130617/70039_1 /TAXON_ID=5936 /ORGANISM="Euplotes crassus, Strain CT5" /LENGTH=168 /DNA_ID=CAMNT_0042439347 /DNA_START=6 /DNA_END=512 /DNA_ORIENTATION=+